MKILYLITKAERGGAQSVVLELLREHKKRGDEILLVSGSSGFLLNEAKGMGFSVSVVTTLGNTFNPLNIIKTFFELRKIAKNFSPDIVSIHSSFAGIVGRFALGKKYKTIFTAHGIAFTSGAPAWRKPIAIASEFLASRFCHKIIAVSEKDRQTILKKLLLKEDKVVTVHNGVFVPETIDFSMKKKNIVFVGRLFPPKTPEILVEAIKILKDEMEVAPNLIVIGDGEKRKILEEKIKQYSLESCVHMMGECGEDMVRKILSESHVFCLPTLWEGFPMTIIEAMASGCVVLASDVGGIGEAVDESVGAIISRGANPKVWADNIKRILQDENKLQEMSKSSHEKAKREFDRDLMVSKVFSLYE